MNSIAVVHTSYKHMGGAERLSLALVEALLKGGHSVTVYTSAVPSVNYLRSVAPELTLAAQALEAAGPRGGGAMGLRVIVTEPALSKLLGLAGRFTRLRTLISTRGLLRLALSSSHDLVIDTSSCLPIAPVVYFHYPRPPSWPARPASTTGSLTTTIAGSS